MAQVKETPGELMESRLGSVLQSIRLCTRSGQQVSVLSRMPGTAVIHGCEWCVEHGKELPCPTDIYHRTEGLRDGTIGAV